METATTRHLRNQPARITAGTADSPSRGNGKTGRRICTLEKALAYKNDDVIYKFLSLYKLPYAEAEDIFRETRRWLWMCAKLSSDRRAKKRKNDPRAAIDKAMIAIDEMWHTFILYTPDYTEFCLRHFDYYIHHVPTRQKEREQYQQNVLNDAAGAMRQTEEEAFAKYEYVYDLFGEEVFKKWFVEYPKKYSVDRLRELYVGLAP
jgi:hypothetical protein